MPVPIEAIALNATEDIIHPTAKDGLCWKPARPEDDRALLPWRTGVYVWVAAGRVEPVLYIGKAGGQEGLRDRLGEQLGWVQRAAYDARKSARSAGAATSGPLSPAAAFAYYAVTDGAKEAKTWEKRLLQHSLRLMGIVPIINGGAWESTSDAAEAAWQWSRVAGGTVAVR